MGKNLNQSDIIKYSLLGVGIFLASSKLNAMFSSVAEGLGIKDSKTDIENKKIIDNAVNAPVNSNINYWGKSWYLNSRPAPQSNYVALVNSLTSTQAIAKRLRSYAGFFNDDETGIYSLFRAFQYKTQVSYLCKVFYELYNEDLLVWLNDEVLNVKEMANVLRITNSLKYGFKNTKTGVIQ